MKKEKRIRQRLPKEVREQQILDAAFNCFCAKGYSGAAINDIVAMSGMSKGNIYWHFSGKEDIFIATMDRWCEKAINELAEDFQTEGISVSEVGRRIADRLYNYITKDRTFMMASLEFDAVAGRDETVRKRLVQLPIKFHELLSGYFKKAMENGEIRQLDYNILAFALDSMFKGIVSNCIVWPEKYAKRKAIEDRVMLVIDSVKT